MSTEPDSNQKPANSEYAIGQDNVRWLGLDVHNPVFFVSATLVVTFVAITIIFLDSAGAAFSDLRIWITTKFDWVFMISMNFFVLFGLFIAYSKNCADAMTTVAVGVLMRTFTSEEFFCQGSDD